MKKKINNDSEKIKKLCNITGYDGEYLATNGINVLGLDLSLSKTGIAIINDSEHYIDVIESEKRGPGRLVEIRDEIVKQIHRLGPGLAVLEGYAYGCQFGREQAGELGGIVRVLLHEMKVTTIIVSPLSVKKYATGSAKGDKAQVMKSVYKKWGLDLNDNNECDAYAIARIGHDILKSILTDSFKHLCGYEIEVIDTIIKGAEPNEDAKQKRHKRVHKDS